MYSLNHSKYNMQIPRSRLENVTQYEMRTPLNCVPTASLKKPLTKYTFVNTTLFPHKGPSTQN